MKNYIMKTFPRGIFIKIAVLIYLRGLPIALAADPQPRFTAPTDDRQLEARVSELRRQYEPFLRSLPQPLPARQRSLLSKDWKFTFELKGPKQDGIPAAPAWWGADLDDSHWEAVTVPEWRYQRGAVSTIGWYRTKFDAVQPSEGRRLWLCFDGVYWEAQVYLNGELLGMHRGYFEPFRFDVTAKIRSQNTLAVRVINGQQFGEPVTYWTIFPDIRAQDQRYVPDRQRSISGNMPIGFHGSTGMGIHRPVYLEQTGPMLITEVFARNDLSDGAARVKVEVESAQAQTVELQADLLPENCLGPTYRKSIRCELPGGKGAQSLTVPMPEARVWTPETPNLYRCRVTIRSEDRPPEARDVLFGCRSFTLVHRKEPPPRPTYQFRAVKAKWLRIVARGNEFDDWNVIREVECPAILRGRENAGASDCKQGHSAGDATDGNPATQWISRSRNSWIQFRLDNAVEFSRVCIDWAHWDYAWDFDLLVSDDAQQWTTLTYQSYPCAADLSGKLPSGMPLLNGKPTYLRGTNIAGLNAYAYWGQQEQLLHTLLLLKAGNFNIVRNCQHVQFPEVREMFDRLGIMSEQDHGIGHWQATHEGLWPEQQVPSAKLLARACYNNPSVVLLCFGNECHFETEPLMRAALEDDPQRIFKPISGRYTHGGGKPLSLSDDLWPHVIDDGHPYSGWYGEVPPQTWRNGYVWAPKRMVTLGEFGAEALDAYETMRDHYPPQFQPPGPETDALWGNSQVQKKDIRQIVGLGRKPGNLLEYIEASQNYQEAVMADKVIAMRLSPMAVAGYFPFHFIDVVPVFWPKSLVSHDHRPKKAYYQLAQINQPLVPLAQLSGKRPDAMTLWVANDLTEAFARATLSWTVSREGRTLLEGRQTLDVPALGAVAVQRIDLLPVVSKHPNFELSLNLEDRDGRPLSRYHRTVRVVPAEVLASDKNSEVEDPFNLKKK